MQPPDTPLNTSVGPEYYDGVRHDAIVLLPEHMERVLEVGCGTGATLAELKRRRRCAWAGGVELADTPGRIAATRLDRIWQGNIEALSLDIREETLDALLCLDVLEHLNDPWSALKRLVSLLKPGGTAIISVPNARNHRVIGDLLWRGRWDYRPSGIMDRTHLRFFTLRTASEMIASSGLTIDRTVPLIHLKPWKLKWISQRLAHGKLDEFYAEQFLIRGSKR